MKARLVGSEPDSPTWRPSRPRGPVDARLWAFSRSVRGYLLALGVLAGLGVLAVVAQAWLVARAISTAVAGQEVAAVAVLPGLAAVLLSRAALSGAGPVIAARATATVKADLRRRLMEARIGATGEGQETSSVVLIATRGLDALDPYFARYLPSLSAAVTVPVVVGTAVATTDWLSALIIALTLPLIPLFMVLVGWTTQELTSRRWRTHLRLAHHFADLVAGLPTLQAFGRARAQAEGLRRSEEGSQRETTRVLRVAFLSALVLELLASLSVAVVAVVVGLRLIGGDLSFFSALFVLLLAPEPFLALRQVGSHFHDSAVGVAAAEQAFAVLDDGTTRTDGAAGPARVDPRRERRPEGRPDDDPARVTAAAAPVPDLSCHSLVLDHVAVRSGSRTRLEPMTLTVRPGEIVALAGPSGSGKSTALAVLAGLLPATAGRVLMGSTDLRALSPEAWWERIGWVGQQPGLISGTVADNIALGDLSAGVDRLRAVLDGVGGHDIPLEQQVHPGSEGLSAGQRRRVALARALTRIGSHAPRETGQDADGPATGGWLLLLDEPTAGLDADAERAAIAAVLRAGVTTVVVSHRPAVLAAVHRIYRLQEHRPHSGRGPAHELPAHRDAASATPRPALRAR